MHKKSILLLFILTCTNVSLKIGASENSAITFNKGLLTTIPGIITVRKITLRKKKILSLIATKKPESIIRQSYYIKNDLIANLTAYHTTSDTRAEFKEESFNPSVWKTTDDETETTHVGCYQSLNERRQEINNAIDEERALYCLAGPGILIYSSKKQPNASMCEKFNTLLNEAYD